MKKSTLLLALLVSATLSFAFYQKADTPARHLLLVVRYELTPTSGGMTGATISTIEAARGAQKTQGFVLRGTRTVQYTALHLAEATKLDSLVADGWSLGHSWGNQTITGIVETTHVLSRNN